METFTDTESTNNEDWLHVWIMTASARGYKRTLTNLVLRESRNLIPTLIFFSYLTTEQRCSFQGIPPTKGIPHTKGNRDDNFLSACFVPGLCSKDPSLILYTFGAFPAVFLLLISGAIPLWSDRILGMISRLSNLLRCVL